VVTKEVSELEALGCQTVRGKSVLLLAGLASLFLFGALLVVVGYDRLQVREHL